jgi:hypothetical protein
LAREEHSAKHTVRLPLPAFQCPAGELRNQTFVPIPVFNAVAFAPRACCGTAFAAIF